MEKNTTENIAERLEKIERMMILAAKDVLNVSECAILLNRSESRIRHMVCQRLIPYYKVGSRTLFSKADIEAHLLQKNNRIPSMAEIEAQAATYTATRKRKN